MDISAILEDGENVVSYFVSRRRASSGKQCSTMQGRIKPQDIFRLSKQ